MNKHAELKRVNIRRVEISDIQAQSCLFTHSHCQKLVAMKFLPETLHVCVCVCMCVCVHVCVCACVRAQSFPTLCDPMDCSPPGSSVHGIFQAKILECVPFPYVGILNVKNHRTT